MNEQERHNLFTELIARHESELYAYIFAIVRNWEDADDLFQSMCVILWRKFESFRPDTSFSSWARQTAKFEARKFLERKRSPTYASEELLDGLADIVIDGRSNQEECHLAALDRCRKKLSGADEELLELHYAENLSSSVIAGQLQRSQSSVCNSMNRIRGWLLECIKMELARQNHSWKESP